MTTHNRKRCYGAEFLPVDEDLLINRGALRKWFDDKKTVIDSNWINDWLNSAIAENNALDETELEIIKDPSKNIDKVNDLSTNHGPAEIQLHDSLPRVNGCELADTKYVIKYYFGKIMRSRITKCQQREFDQRLLPNTKRKGFIAIKSDVRITSYTSSDNDSVDTAEYIRGARGKGNKSLQGKNNLIKQHSDMKNIESNKTFQTEGNIKKINHQQNTLDDSGSPYYNTNKVRRKRFQKRYSRNLKKSRLYSSSSSSSEDVFPRLPNGIRNSRSLPRLNLTHNQSEDTDYSDPDYKILDKVRKSHNIIVKPVVVNPFKTTPIKSANFLLNQTAESIIEFPSEPEQQLQVNSSIKFVDNERNQISNSTEENSETDVLFMSNKKRFRLYGKYFVDQPLVLNNSRSNIQNDWGLNESSTDDGLFKSKSYKHK